MVENLNVDLQTSNTTVENLKADLQASNITIENLKADLQTSKTTIENLMGDLQAIISSKSWKVTKPLRYIMHILRRIKLKIGM